MLNKKFLSLCFVLLLFGVSCNKGGPKVSKNKDIPTEQGVDSKPLNPAKPLGSGLIKLKK